MPYASYRLFHLYHVSLDTPNAMQTSDIVLPERSGSIIILYLFSISTCFTLQDWSVNYVRKLKCQLCMEAAQLINFAGGISIGNLQQPMVISNNQSMVAIIWVAVT